MAIVLVDGFDSGTSAGALGYNPGGTCFTVQNFGRFANGALSFGNGQATKSLPSTYTSLGAHVAWFANPGSFSRIIALCEGVGATIHVDVTRNASGFLEARRAGTTVLGTGTTFVPLSTWHGIEIFVTISDTVGVVKVYLNGALEINLSSVDTKNGGTGVIDSLFTTAAYGATDQYFWDDLVVYDTSGSVNNVAPIGDVRVETLYPSGDGNYSQLAGSDGNSTNNSLLVDEAAPNSDTDYVESSTVGDKDTYALGNLAVTTGSVLAVAARLFARKTDAGTRQVSPLYRLSGTDMDGATKTLASGYATYPDTPQEAKPGGGSWSISDVNSLEAGMKIVA